MKENTKTLGAWYINFTKTTWFHAGPPIQRAWTNEVEEPWRHGVGLFFRVLPFLAITIGRWHPIDPTDIKGGVASQPEIKDWKRSLKRIA